MVQHYMVFFEINGQGSLIFSMYVNQKLTNFHSKILHREHMQCNRIYFAS
jgi:hypothetical protein